MIAGNEMQALRVAVRIRWVEVVLCAVALLANLHFCAPQWHLPDGSACIECPTIDEHEEISSNHSEIRAHDDCHDCCTLEACSHTPSPKASNLTPTTVWACLPALPSHSVAIPILPSIAPISRDHTVHWANAPPGICPGRAPPI